MIALGRLLFFATILSVAFLVHRYLYRRLVRDVTASRRLRGLGGAAGLLLGLTLAGGPVAMRLYPGPVASAVGKTAFAWMGIAFFLLVALLAADLVRRATDLVVRVARPPRPEAAPPDPARRAFLSRAAGAGAVAVAAGASGWGTLCAFEPPLVTDLPVLLPRLGRHLSGLTIVQLTDLHVGAWLDDRFVSDTAERVRALKPDLLAITGDLVDGSVEELGRWVAPLARVPTRFGVHFVTGNHEYYSGDVAWAEALERMGVVVLRNRAVPIGGRGGFDLVGVDDWNGRRFGGTSGWDLAAATAGRDPERAGVLLAHQPLGVEEAARAGLGLQLSGHTHGGQMWPWTFAVRVAYRYVAGLYRIGDMALYVSRGTGFWGPPMRLRAPPEIVRITLT